MASILGLDFTRNLSAYTVPAAFVLCMVPNVYAVVNSGKAFDNAYPRSLKDNVSGDNSVEKAQKGRILRAKAASENGFETLGFYAAAVALANQAGLEPTVLNYLTYGYLLSRAGFIFTYVKLQDNRQLAVLRSVFWVIGISLTATLYIKAGNKLAANNFF